MIKGGVPFLLALCLAAAPSARAALSAAAGKADITPDLARETAWLAGYGATGRKARGVHDPLHARALVVSDGARTVAIVGVDSIGLFREDVQEMRRRLGWTGSDKYLFVSATHEHSGPDTLGLWGRFPGVSGLDERYHERLLASIVGLVKQLEGGLVPAELRVARARLDPKGLTRDIRDPAVIDPELAVVQLRARAAPRALLGTVVRWSCHPETIRAENFLLTADYPGTLCAKVEAETGGACLFQAGAIGGLLIPDSDHAPERQFDEMKRVGETLALKALAAAAKAPWISSGAVAFASKTVKVRVDNSRYLLFMPNLTFGHRLLAQDGRPLSRWETYWLPLRHLLSFPLPERLRPWVESEVSRVAIGPAVFLGIPGELLPELAIGGYDGSYRFSQPLIRPGNQNPPDLTRAPKGPYIRDLPGGKDVILVGLANDELGYIIPEYDFQVAATRSMEPQPAGTHYEETNSIAPSAARIVLEAVESLLKP